MSPPAPKPAPARARRPATGPGRPKDLGKRAAILDAAKRIFTAQGFGATSMDQIAAEAGVSKLTVYSHFGDKEALFAAAVEAHCTSQLPPALFDPQPDTPLRERLLGIARAFYSMVSSPEAVAGHRMLCTPQLAGTALSKLFWEAGPQRVHDQFAQLLQRRIDAGELRIGDGPADVARAASQFFVLLKGEPHARMVFGCCERAATASAARAHVEASVDMFLRAYGTPDGVPAPAARKRARRAS
jgi:TetR/AcrR family transcriptional repressor of mexJK operon